MYDSDGKYIDTMQVCMNGHVVNDSYHRSPESNQDYCEKCGEKTITECEDCRKSIPGRIHYEGVVSLYFIKIAPDYCRYCNKPYPWNKGVRKSGRGVKSGFGYLKRFIEWSAEVIRKLRKK